MTTFQNKIIWTDQVKAKCFKGKKRKHLLCLRTNIDLLCK